MAKRESRRRVSFDVSDNEAALLRRDAHPSKLLRRCVDETSEVMVKERRGGGWQERLVQRARVDL